MSVFCTEKLSVKMQRQKSSFIYTTCSSAYSIHPKLEESALELPVLIASEVIRYRRTRENGSQPWLQNTIVQDE